jgi:hypothetical protein
VGYAGSRPGQQQNRLGVEVIRSIAERTNFLAPTRLSGSRPRRGSRTVACGRR